MQAYQIKLNSCTALFFSKALSGLLTRAYSGSTGISVHSGTSQDPERSLTDYIHHLEKVQRRLVGSKPGKKHDLAGYRRTVKRSIPFLFNVQYIMYWVVEPHTP